MVNILVEESWRVIIWQLAFMVELPLKMWCEVGVQYSKATIMDELCSVTLEDSTCATCHGFSKLYFMTPDAPLALELVLETMGASRLC